MWGTDDGRIRRQLTGMDPDVCPHGNQRREIIGGRPIKLKCCRIPQLEIDLGPLRSNCCNETISDEEDGSTSCNGCGAPCSTHEVADEPT